MKENISSKGRPPLLDSRGRPVRVREVEGGSDRVAVFYPGLSYGLQAPLFFYLGQALETAGWSVLGVDYRYNEDAEFLAASEADRATWLRDDSLAVGRWVADRVAGAERMAYLGKSLGTTLLLEQLVAGLIPHRADLVWLTPAGEVEALYGLLPELPNRSLVAVGTVDPYHRPALAAGARTLPLVRVVEVPGAGHSFEVPRNVNRSITNLAAIVESVVTFLAEVHG